MDLDIDPISHVASRFAHAVEMLTELIPYTTDPTLPRVVQIACLEDWFTNYRLLIEFLVMKPPRHCASAKTFLPAWEARDSTIVKALRADFGWASEDVSHIAYLNPIDRGSIEPATLKTKARTLLALVADLADALRFARHDYEPMIRVALDSSLRASGSAGESAETSG